MGRLFWKFSIAYWMALMAAVLGLAGAGWVSRMADQTADLTLESGPRAGFLVHVAEIALRHGGLSALRELLDDWSRHGDVAVFAVDVEGRDVLGRPVSESALARAEQVVGVDPHHRGTRWALAPDGQRYLLFVSVEGTPLWRRLLFGGVFGSTRQPSLVAVIAGVLASLVFGALIAWYVTRPIGHLRTAFDAVAAGRLETRVAPLMGRRRDEVADLGRDFDGMAQKLQVLIGAQRALLHDVSHELRSPLARLQAAIGLLRQNPKRLEASLDRIEREAERVDELVGELLTLSRLESGGADGLLGRRERLDLVDLVAAVAGDADFEAQSSARRVAFTAGSESLELEGYPELLHRAVENLVRNAVRYTAPETLVDVEVRRSASGGAALVSVSDRGPGVTSEELGRIFEPFHRGGGGAEGDGFGLGLAIARRAVEAHGGRIQASPRPGGGLCFDVSLPLPGGAAP